MKIDKIGGHKIELYNSIDELPTDRFSTYNRLLLIDSGIGSDMESVDSHITKIQRYINSDKKEEANKELLNMRMNMYFVMENTSPKYLSYIALIHKIDDKLVTDFSEENLQRILEKLTKWGAKRSYFESALDVIKKKLEEELETYFPNIFESADRKEAMGELKRRAKLMLLEIARGENHTGEINEIDNFLFGLAKPQSFDGKSGSEVSYVKNYEEMSLVLTKYSLKDAKKMSVLEYYQAFSALKKENKRNSKGLKK